MSWAEDLLTELGRRSGLAVALSQQGTCTVAFGKDEIFFEVKSDRLFIIADLGAVYGLDQNFKELLEACNIGGQTAFGSLGIDAVRQELVLTRVLSAEVSYDKFEQILSMFVRVLRYWKRRLTKLAAAVDHYQPESGGGMLRNILP